MYVKLDALDSSDSHLAVLVLPVLCGVGYRMLWPVRGKGGSSFGLGLLVRMGIWWICGWTDMRKVKARIVARMKTALEFMIASRAARK